MDSLLPVSTQESRNSLYFVQKDLFRFLKSNLFILNFCVVDDDYSYPIVKCITRFTAPSFVCASQDNVLVYLEYYNDNHSEYYVVTDLSNNFKMGNLLGLKVKEIFKSHLEQESKFSLNKKNICMLNSGEIYLKINGQKSINGFYNSVNNAINLFSDYISQLKKEMADQVDLEQ